MRKTAIIDKTDKPVVLLRFYKKKVVEAVMPLWWCWDPEYNSLPQVIYYSHYSNGVPAVFTS